MNHTKISVPHDLALRLSDWHSSMHDPVYAVSSSGMAKRAVPRSVFEAALANMESVKYREEYPQSIEEISLAMRAILGESVDVRKTIIHAMARYLWADAWATRVEEGEDGFAEISLGGQELTHAAPETSPAAMQFATEMIEKFETLNSKTIEEIFAAERNPLDAYEYGGCLAGSFLGHGIDFDIGDYKTPYCDSWSIIPGPEAKVG